MYLRIPIYIFKNIKMITGSRLFAQLLSLIDCNRFKKSVENCNDETASKVFPVGSNLYLCFFVRLPVQSLCVKSAVVCLSLAASSNIWGTRPLQKHLSYANRPWQLYKYVFLNLLNVVCCEAKVHGRKFRF